MSFREGQGQQHRRFLERSNEVMEFSINIARSKSQGQISPKMIRVCINTARSKGQGKKKHRRFLERSNEVMEFSINTAKLKGQGQPSFPAKCVKTRRFEAV